MTLPYRKKLIEVGLPLVAINAESAREKSIRHGHPSTLHLWWARRPLAACRAVLFSSLVDDPDSDPAFHKADGSVDEDRAGIKRADLFNFIEELVMWDNSNNVDVIRTARAEIARCVASRLIETGALKKDTVVGPKTTAYDLVTLGHCKPVAMGLDKKVGRVRFTCDVTTLPHADVVNAFLAEHAPPVLDPFAGGGSIPLEAQRLGLRAFASDLNPVPVLINKALLEIPPKFAGRPPVNPESRGEGGMTKGKGRKSPTLFEKEWRGAIGLAEDVRYYGKWMREEAEKRIGHLYPKVTVTAELAQNRPDLLPYVGQELTVIAWLWARTIQCPNPVCRARAPLVRSFWLSTKKGKEVFAKPIIDAQAKTVTFNIAFNGDAPKHTSDRNGARCLFCNTFIKKQQLRDISVEHGVPEIPLAIVAEGSRGRVYLSGDAMPRLDVTKPDVSFIEQPITNDRRWFSPPLYGMTRFADLFTSRQLVALTTFSELVSEARSKIRAEASQSAFPDDTRPLSDGGVGVNAYADAVAVYLGFCVDKITDTNSTLCTWQNNPPRLRATFGRQALAMTWDIAEAGIFGDAAGDFQRAYCSLCEVLDNLHPGIEGNVTQADARDVSRLPEHIVISTDPPYYDNIGYADLSDYFYVWLRKSIGSIYPSLFTTMLTPKTSELIASAFRHEGSKARAQTFFEEGLFGAFSSFRERVANDSPMTVYYAFKQTEDDDEAGDGDVQSDVDSIAVSTGWETILSGLVRSGFSISGTWPMRSELKTRNVGRDTNALASSIVLVCRPRPESASLATRKEFITALRRELPEALRNLQRGNIAPVDLAQAAIGPGMAVFTRYAKVLESNGSPMTVRMALGLINQSLDEVLTEQEGEFDNDTRWALAWFEQYGIDEGPFGDAETLSKAKNTAVNGLVEAGVIKAHAGKVRLLRREELPADWNPATDKRIAVWEVTQHLIRILDKEGEERAAALVEQLGGMAEIARDLSYRLYSTCERKKWAEEAMAYNGLVIAWPELTKLALAERTRRPTTQQGEFF